MSISLEITFLDVRYFLDDALVLMEAYESNERNEREIFHLNSDHLSKVRHGAIEFIRSMIEIKKHLNEENSYQHFNSPMQYSNNFDEKRAFFFKHILGRVNNLYNLVDDAYYCDSLIRMYVRTLRVLVLNTCELIGYFETVRWNRNIAIEIVDRLLETSNNFAAIFEKFLPIIESILGHNRDTNHRTRKNPTIRSTATTSSNESVKSKLSSIRRVPIIKNKDFSKNRKLFSNQDNIASSATPSKRKVTFSCFKFSCFLIFLFVLAYVVIFSFNFFVDLFDSSLNGFENAKLNKIYTRKSLFFDTIRVIETDSITLDLNSVYFWTQVYEYMTSFSLIFFCLFFYILFEFLCKRKIL